MEVQQQNDSYQKKGYLTDDYRVFYLEENETKEYESHYHDFDKLIFFMKGNVKYTIEGKTYELLPEDVVLVPHGDVHKVEIEKSMPYERLVIYLSPQYLLQWKKKGADLSECFLRAKDAYANVIRFHNRQDKLYQLAKQLKSTIMQNKEEKMAPLLQETWVLQFLIFLNRAMQAEHITYVDSACRNIKIVEMIRYINSHLTEEISIDGLSQQFYISRYHMMRQFKNETGYSIGSYISNKRLLYARELIRQGEPVTKVCFDCGFREHSTFNRAYKQLFGVTPIKSREED